MWQGDTKDNSLCCRQRCLACWLHPKRIQFHLKMIQSRITIHPCVLHCIHNTYVLRTSDMHNCTAAATHRRSARVRALLLRRRPSVCPSILFPLSDFSRQWSPGVDQVRTKIIESILKDEEGSLTFWKYGPNHRSPARLCRHCWRCYRRWRLEHRQPACCRCQEGETVKYLSSFPPYFILVGCDTITGKTELKFWQRQDHRSALEYNFFWDVEHWVRWVNACGENILNWNQRAASTIKSLGNCGKIMGSWGDQRIQTKLSSASIQFSDKT